MVEQEKRMYRPRRAFAYRSNPPAQRPFYSRLESMQSRTHLPQSTELSKGAIDEPLDVDQENPYAEDRHHIQSAILRISDKVAPDVKIEHTTKMSVAEAYAVLGIPNKDADMHPRDLEELAELMLESYPENLDTMQKAIAIVCHDRKISYGGSLSKIKGYLPMHRGTTPFLKKGTEAPLKASASRGTASISMHSPLPSISSNPAVRSKRPSTPSTPTNAPMRKRLKRAGPFVESSSSEDDESTYTKNVPIRRPNLDRLKQSIVNKSTRDNPHQAGALHDIHKVSRKTKRQSGLSPQDSRVQQAADGSHYLEHNSQPNNHHIQMQRVNTTNGDNSFQHERRTDTLGTGSKTQKRSAASTVNPGDNSAHTRDTNLQAALVVTSQKYGRAMVEERVNADSPSMMQRSCEKNAIASIQARTAARTTPNSAHSLGPGGRNAAQGPPAIAPPVFSASLERPTTTPVATTPARPAVRHSEEHSVSSTPARSTNARSSTPAAHDVTRTLRSPTSASQPFGSSPSKAPFMYDFVSTSRSDRLNINIDDSGRSKLSLGVGKPLANPKTFSNALPAERVSTSDGQKMTSSNKHRTVESFPKIARFPNGESVSHSSVKTMFTTHDKATDRSKFTAFTPTHAPLNASCLPCASSTAAAARPFPVRGIVSKSILKPVTASRAGNSRTFTTIKRSDLSIEPAHSLERVPTTSETAPNLPDVEPTNMSESRPTIYQTPDGRKLPVVDLENVLPPPHFDRNAEPYFEYTVFQKQWSDPDKEGDASGIELTGRMLTSVDTANTRAKTLFASTKQQHLFHQAQLQDESSNRNEDDCMSYTSTFAPIYFPSRQSYLKIWVERRVVSAAAASVDPPLQNTPLISKTLYIVHLCKLIELPVVELSDSESSSDSDASSSESSSDSSPDKGKYKKREKANESRYTTSTRKKITEGSKRSFEAATIIRQHYPLHDISDVFTTLDAANYAALDVQIEFSHERSPDKILQKQWQVQNMRELRVKAQGLCVEKKLWKSEFKECRLRGDRFELVVEKVRVCGPRNI